MHRFVIASIAVFALPLAALADPLPSWKAGAAKDSIIAFVETVTDPQSENYVPMSDRIAVFDNDGTLWAEQPLTFQLAYALDMVRQRAEDDPSILGSEALSAAANGDFAAIREAGSEAILEVLNVSHANVTPTAFMASVHEWLTTTEHPTSGMVYADMTYQPMTELLRYMRDEGFSTYIVSGGSLFFMRAITEEIYNIPPSQIIGSIGNMEYSVVDGEPTLTKQSGALFFDRSAGKPVGIMNHIGQRPIFAAGNTDGDFQMLEWVTAGEGARFGMLIHHTDGEREFAYDRESAVGSLNRGLDEADTRGWLLVDMAKDWRRVWSGAE
ncbi:HAD family hydrolase [Marivita sp. S0852]|uniref:HAD family hydrolase n=1 Tax=Marivita sp. S0852 TaxID=3373893 RepID=UPI003981F94A